ncbi:MAG: site-2 protease family protein [Pseudomonadales bacterium]|nr:site-2 protease family protein [Pseudomonadales bacterium]
MNDEHEAGRRSETVSHSMPLFRIFGIEIRLDISVIVIFFLIVYSLGSGIFPQWHPDWSRQTVWITAFVSGILFFVSLLAHELSHSVVAKHYGIPVPRITLFLFGGMAETSHEPEEPKVEFLVAIAGPLMSMVISLVCTNLAWWVAGSPEFMSDLSLADEESLAQLGPTATSLLWLGSINMILAIFNLIPGFPMDGGRVFRAIIWGITGDQVRATRWASNGGRYFGWTLMGLGVLSLFGGGGFSGVWWILIGWFITSLATMSYRQLITDRALRGFRVKDLMRTRFDHVPENMPIPDFVDQYLLRSTQQLWPVEQESRSVGVVSLQDVIELSEDERQGKVVGDVMRRTDSLSSLSPETRARDAFRELAGANDEPLPVVEGERIVGLIQRGDIVKWMSLHDLD